MLDTPPSRNALDFLDAPGRLTSFLEGRTLQAFVRPTGLGMRVLGRGASPLLGALRRVTGVDLRRDLSTFFGLLGDMTDDFSARAQQVERMLRAPTTTAFVLVTSAHAAAIDEAIWFRRTLARAGCRSRGVIVNRFHHDMLGDAEPDDVVSALDAEPAGRPRRAGRRQLRSTTTGSPGATRRNVARLSAELRRSAAACSSPTSTTTSTTSTACSASTASCSPPTPSAQRLIADVVA